MFVIALTLSILVCVQSEQFKLINTTEEISDGWRLASKMDVKDLSANVKIALHGVNLSSIELIDGCLNRGNVNSSIKSGTCKEYGGRLTIKGSYSCMFRPGWGRYRSRGEYKELGELLEETCISTCKRKQRGNKYINGITIYLGKLCYCLTKMYRRDTRTNAKSCFLIPTRTVNKCNLTLGKVENRDIIRAKDKILSWQKCSNLCRAEPLCKLWSWRTEGSKTFKERCDLYKKGVVSELKENAISGPRDCGEVVDGDRESGLEFADLSSSSTGDRGSGLEFAGLSNNITSNIGSGLESRGLTNSSTLAHTYALSVIIVIILIIIISVSLLSLTDYQRIRKAQNKKIDYTKGLINEVTSAVPDTVKTFNSMRYMDPKDEHVLYASLARSGGKTGEQLASEPLLKPIKLGMSDIPSDDATAKEENVDEAVPIYMEPGSGKLIFGSPSKQS